MRKRRNGLPSVKRFALTPSARCGGSVKESERFSFLHTRALRPFGRFVGSNLTYAVCYALRLFAVVVRKEGLVAHFTKKSQGISI